MQLVLQPPTHAPAADPLTVLVITMAAFWVFGSPWVRLCWWLGTRTRRPDPA